MRLTPAEVYLAGQAGFARTLRARIDGRSLEDGRRDFGFERDVQGAIAEYAVAKFLNVCWTPAIGDLDLHGDLPGVCQVKSSTHPRPSLIVRKHDIDTLPYVLVRLDSIVDVELVGWIEGADAKDPLFWREVDPSRGIHQAAFFVPGSSLLPMEELLD